ncbi:MAG: S8 family serine peptidase [Planctomycetota bacterium]
MRRADRTKHSIILNTVVLLATAALASAEADPVRYVPDEVIVKFRQAAADKLHQQLNLDASPGKLALSDELDQFNAKYRIQDIEPVFKNFRQRHRQVEALRSKDPALLSKKQEQLLSRLARAPKGAKVPALDRIYKITLDLEAGQSLREVLEAYRSSPDVEYAELNYIVSTCAEPNDPLFDLQWALHNTGQLYPESGRYNDPPGTPDSDIDAPAAWNLNADAPDVVVAVLDTGADYTHGDLDDNMWINEAELYGLEGVDDDDNNYPDDIYGYDFINGDPDPQDDNGHGTHVSGVIAAEGNNGRDIAGVCWKTRIMALKFLGADGNGDSADAAVAVYYAVANAAHIISNSWGGIPLPGSYPRYLEDAFDYAYSQGVISVAAAGNNGSTFINYPAIFDNVIAVAATNSNDKRPSFSNYGALVEIAAPGVDILSLRAQLPTSPPGTVYDANTTIMSGTSMACPHVSGAFALVLAFYPRIDIDLARDIIFESTDPLPPQVVVWGRLNLYKALWQISGYHKGTVQFDRNVYSCSDTIGILLSDLSLAGDTVADVNVTTADGDLETVVLTEEGEFTGVFSGTIATAAGNPLPEDDTLQVSHGQKITVIYEDENDGTGNPATDTDNAKADCVPPVIFNVQIDVPGPEPRVTFETNEPTTAVVFAGTECGGPYVLEPTDPQIRRSHTVSLLGVLPETDYFFIVQANDVAGNKTIDDNNGLCYAFTTTGPGDIFVPSQYPTIQEGIFRAWDTGIVWVADGTYTGDGNRDIDFMGKAITLRSENGPQNCIVDCQGTITDRHYGFMFDEAEGPASVLKGFTITNGYITNYAHGGAITCSRTNPTITECVLTANSAYYGGAIACKTASPTIAECTITANTARFGGAVSGEDSNAVITGCVVAGNRAERGGGFWARKGKPHIINSTFTGNRAEVSVGGVFCWRGGETISNCIIWANSAPQSPQLPRYQNPTYCCIQDWNDGGFGNISTDPCFVDPGHWADINDLNTVVEPNHPNAFWIQGDYHLMPASHCIDTGDPNYPHHPNQTDIDDQPRIFASRIDIGADEFVPMTTVPMRFTPQVFQPAGKGRWIKAHLVLPEGFDINDVDTNTPATLKFFYVQISSEQIDVFVNEDGLVEIVAAFDRTDFCPTGPAEGTVKVVGLLTSGQYYCGLDKIRIVNKLLHHLAVISSRWLSLDCGPPDWCDGLDFDRNSSVDFRDFATLDTCCIEIVSR